MKLIEFYTEIQKFSHALYFVNSTFHKILTHSYLKTQFCILTISLFFKNIQKSRKGSGFRQDFGKMGPVRQVPYHDFESLTDYTLHFISKSGDCKRT